MTLMQWQKFQLQPPVEVSCRRSWQCEEMLFYPLETAEEGDQPISLDEGPIAEEDTKPRAIKTEAVDTVEAIAVAAGVIGAMAPTDEEPVLKLLAGEEETPVLLLSLKKKSLSW